MQGLGHASYFSSVLAPRLLQDQNHDELRIVSPEFPQFLQPKPHFAHEKRSLLHLRPVYLRALLLSAANLAQGADDKQVTAFRPSYPV